MFLCEPRLPLRYKPEELDQLLLRRYVVPNGNCDRVDRVVILQTCWRCDYEVNVT